MSRINKKAAWDFHAAFLREKTRPSLESQFQPELDDALGIVNHCSDFTNIAGGCVTVREPEIDIVKEVEEFSSELKVHPLTDAGNLQEPEVRIEKPWSSKNVSPRVAERPNGIGRE